MPLIPHICANCHGQIQFDDSRDSGFCPYCGTAYTREDVIVNQNVTINVDGSNLNVKDENWYKTSTYQFLVDGYFGKANDYAMEYYENYPTSESARKCQENISTIFDLFINKELFAPTYAFESHSYRLNPNRDENTCCLPTSIFEDTFNNHINKITDLVKSMDFPDDRFLNHLVNELNYTKSCEFERSLNIERYISEDNLSDAIQAERKNKKMRKRVQKLKLVIRNIRLSPQ